MPTPPTNPSPGPASTDAEIRSPGVSAVVDLRRASLGTAAGGPLLTPAAAGVVRWTLLDRSPLSARLAGEDAAGRAVASCRYEAVEGGVLAQVAGGSFAERAGGSVFIAMGG